MQNKEIVIEIDKKTAKITMEAVGYNGQHCTTDLNEIEKILSAKSLSRRQKPEMVQRVNRQSTKR